LAVSSTDRLVAIGPQSFGGLVKLIATQAVVLGEHREAISGFWRLTLWAGDSRIV
jgi:hypothetical protein